MEWLKHLVILRNIEGVLVNGWAQGIRYIKYYPNGHFYYMYNYLDDQQHGAQFKWCAASNKLVGMDTYINGTLNGIQRTWYDNGQLEEDYIYVDDLWHGIQRRWYANGQ
jgi:antitoxin component YwqK of YwqJK toxin-antitoxin module